MRLELKVAMQNDGDFVDVMLLYTKMGVRNTLFITLQHLESVPK
jgi:hypothetical protein